MKNYRACPTLGSATTHLFFSLQMCGRWIRLAQRKTSYIELSVLRHLFRQREIRFSDHQHGCYSPQFFIWLQPPSAQRGPSLLLSSPGFTSFNMMHFSVDLQTPFFSWTWDSSRTSCPLAGGNHSSLSRGFLAQCWGSVASTHRQEAAERGDSRLNRASDKSYHSLVASTRIYPDQSTLLSTINSSMQLLRSLLASHFPSSSLGC